AGIADLPPAAAAHEAAQLLLDRAVPPLGLFRQRAERPEVAVRLDDLEHALGAERPDQFAFEVGLADEDARERAPEPGGLAGVDEADEARARVACQRAPHRLGAADRLDRGAVGREIAPE